MAMRDRRSSMNPIKKLFGWLTGEAERHRNNTHERAISVAILVVTAGDFSAHTVCDTRQGTTCRDPNIEHPSMRSPQFFPIPCQESLSHILGVEFMPSQAIRRTEQQGRVIGPCPGRLIVRSEPTHIGHRIDPYFSAILELHRHAQRVADEGTPERAVKFRSWAIHNLSKFEIIHDLFSQLLNPLTLKLTNCLAGTQ